jgi:hypothetical protein
MKNILMRTVASFLLLLQCQVAYAGEVQIYIDGCPRVFQVPDDLEMYELEPVLILEDNRQLLKEYCIACPQQAIIGAGNQSWNRQLDQQDEYFGDREIQPYIRDIRYRDYLSSEEWNGAWGDLNYPGRMKLDLDHSGLLWNFDGSYMHHESNAGGPDGKEEEESFKLGHKERSQLDFTLRSGSMDGGHQFLRGQYYKINADEMPFQIVDVEHWRIGTGFRMVECPGMLQLELFSGMYKSDRAVMDNTYTGASADAYLWLGNNASLVASGQTVDIDAKLQNGKARRSDTDGELSYQLNDDLAISASVSGYSDTSNISIVSDTRNYSERAANLSYHPSSAASVNLTVARREVDFQRLTSENEALYAINLRDPELGRADLAAFRIDEQASYDSLRLKSNFRLDSCSRLSADFRRDDYGTLPEVGDYTSLSLMPAYFANERQWSSLYYERSLSNGGRLELNAAENRRENELRDSFYCSRRLALSYGQQINSCSRWKASLGRSETDLTGSGIDAVWDSSSNNYGLDFSGYGDWADYRFSLGHHVRDGSSSGDYSSLGLELDFADSPLVLNSWWRKQQSGLQPALLFDDIGLSLGWQVQF